MELIKAVRNRRSILGARFFFWSLTPPPPPVGAGVGKPPHGLGVCIWMPLVNGTGNSPSPGRPTPGVVKQDKSSGGSVDTTKTRSGPQRVRMSSGERPIGAAKGKQSDPEAFVPTPAPPPPRPGTGPGQAVTCTFECAATTHSEPRLSLRRLMPPQHPSPPAMTHG